MTMAMVAMRYGAFDGSWRIPFCSSSPSPFELKKGPKVQTSPHDPPHMFAVGVADLARHGEATSVLAGHGNP